MYGLGQDTPTGGDPSILQPTRQASHSDLVRGLLGTCMVEGPAVISQFRVFLLTASLTRRGTASTEHHGKSLKSGVLPR